MDTIIKWNDLLLTWNSKYIRTAAGGGGGGGGWPTSGLVARWPLQSSLVDTVAGNNFAVNTGSVSYAAGLVGNALSLTNTDSVWLNANPTIYNTWLGVNSFTFAYWMKIISPGPYNQLSPAYVSDAGTYDYFPLEGPPRLSLARNGGSDFTGSGISDLYQNWRFMCFNYTYPNLTLYSNNVQIASLAKTWGASGGSLNINPGGNNNLRGNLLVQFAYLYDHELSSGDKTILYNSGTPI